MGIPPKSSIDGIFHHQAIKGYLHDLGNLHLFKISLRDDGLVLKLICHLSSVQSPNWRSIILIILVGSGRNAELMDYNSRDIWNSNSGKSQPPVLSPERPSPELDIIQNEVVPEVIKN